MEVEFGHYHPIGELAFAVESGAEWQGNKKMVAVRAVPPENAGTMQKNTATQSMRRSLPALAQIVQLIPPGMIESLAEGSHVKARRFSYGEQVFSLMLGQLCGAFSLNEICDTEEVHRKKLFRVRGMLPARRNTFSNANRTRNHNSGSMAWKNREFDFHGVEVFAAQGKTTAPQAGCKGRGRDVRLRD